MYIYQTGLPPANVGFYRALINHHRKPGTNPVAVVPHYFAGDGSMRARPPLDDPLTEPQSSSLSSLSTWEALCKDCKNLALGDALKDAAGKKAKDDLRQEHYEYSDVHASRQLERGQSRSDRCPECRKRHKKRSPPFLSPTSISLR